VYYLTGESELKSMRVEINKTIHLISWNENKTQSYEFKQNNIQSNRMSPDRYYTNKIMYLKSVNKNSIIN